MDSVLMSRLSCSGNAQLRAAYTELRGETEQLPACCIPNKCLVAVTHATDKHLENIMLQLQEWWLRFPTCKGPLKRNYEAAWGNGTWLLNPRLWTGQRTTEQRAVHRGLWQWSLPGQDKPVLPNTSGYQFLLLWEDDVINTNSSFPSVFAQFCMCWLWGHPSAASSLEKTCSVCAQGRQAKPTFSRIMACLKDREVVKRRALHRVR